jgi:hypothetical protein
LSLHRNVNRARLALVPSPFVVSFDRNREGETCMKKISAAVLSLSLVSFATSALACPYSQKTASGTPPVVATPGVDRG